MRYSNGSISLPITWYCRSPLPAISTASPGRACASAQRIASARFGSNVIVLAIVLLLWNEVAPLFKLEAYRGGRLISFDSVNALGQFSLDVPIQYGENPVDFITGAFFTVQSMAGLPLLPPGRTVIGQGYNLVASPGATLPITSSVSIQYLSHDVEVAGAEEKLLACLRSMGDDLAEGERLEARGDARGARAVVVGEQDLERLLAAQRGGSRRRR